MRFPSIWGSYTGWGNELPQKGRVPEHVKQQGPTVITTLCSQRYRPCLQERAGGTDICVPFRSWLQDMRNLWQSCRDDKVRGGDFSPRNVRLANRVSENQCYRSPSYCGNIFGSTCKSVFSSLNYILLTISLCLFRWLLRDFAYPFFTHRCPHLLKAWGQNLKNINPNRMSPAQQFQTSRVLPKV